MTVKKQWQLSLLKLSGNAKTSCESQPTNWQLLATQLLDSVIVGAIAGLSAYIAAGDDATLKAFGLAFGITFLLKLKDYRKIA
jgi:hypothetical protein